MLFSEVYGSYYNVLAAVLGEAVEGTLTRQRLYAIIREKAFGESAVTIPANLRDGTWKLLTEDLKTPLRQVPTMPLTTLQRRWLKTILLDPRVRLFGVDDTGLEDAEPLAPAGTVVFFDQYADGDPYADPDYIARFRAALRAIREGRDARLRYLRGDGTESVLVCRPLRLEYSAKDDKFRLITEAYGRQITFNVARLREVIVLERPGGEIPPARAVGKDTLVLEIRDERNALERVMLHFSHFEKQAEQIADRRYRLTLRYDRRDETELVIRVLSFGPRVRAVSPDRFVSLLRERLRKQAELKNRS